MAADSAKEVVGDIAGEVPAANEIDKTKSKKQKKEKGLLLRIWNGIFRLHGDDFEKRLQYISKKEAAVLAKMKRRSQSCRRMTRNLIILSVLLEVIAVGYAIMTTRSLDLDWKMRALRVLPMFLLPGLSFLTYSVLGSFTRMHERKDQKTLERLRGERQAKIDELKEKTNYYTTQQLIQRYDPDPAAKAAAATILASKLGADSGLKVYLRDEPKLDVPTGKRNDVELVQPGGLRNRKQMHTGISSQESTIVDRPNVDMHRGLEGPENAHHHQIVVEHFQSKVSSTRDGGWLARLAALLVGEDPTQSYALICGNCRMHNGLARKEDFPYITYYCPRCNALNRHKQQDEKVSGFNSPTSSSSVTGSVGGGEIEVARSTSGSVVDKVSTSDPVSAPASSMEIDKISSRGPGS